MTPAASRIVPLERAVPLVRAWREAGDRVAVVSGDFDLLAVSHVHAVAAARAGAERVVVAVRADAAAAARGPAGRPVLPARDRAALAAALRGVDLVVVLEEPSASAPREALGAQAHSEVPPGPDPIARTRARHAEGA